MSATNVGKVFWIANVKLRIISRTHEFLILHHAVLVFIVLPKWVFGYRSHAVADWLVSLIVLWDWGVGFYSISIDIWDCYYQLPNMSSRVQGQGCSSHCRKDRRNLLAAVRLFHYDWVWLCLHSVGRCRQECWCIRYWVPWFFHHQVMSIRLLCLRVRAQRHGHSVLLPTICLSIGWDQTW